MNQKMLSWMLAAVSSVLMTVAPVVGRQVQGPAIPVQVIPQGFAFGDVMPEVKVTGEVMLFNTSNAPLAIREARATCSCTVPELKEKIIQPQQAIPLTAVFEAPEFMGPVRRNVLVYFEGYEFPLKLDVDAHVNYGIKPLMKYIPEGQYRTGILELESSDDQPFRVLSVDGKPPVDGAGNSLAGTDPRHRYELAIDLSEYSEENLPRWLLVETDHPTAPIIDIRTVASIEAVSPQSSGRKRDLWAFKPDRALLWTIKPGETKEFTIGIQGGVRDPLVFFEDYWFEGDVLDVRMTGMEYTAKGLKLRFVADTDPAVRGVLFATLHVRGKGEVHTVDLIGRVVDPSGKGS